MSAVDLRPVLGALAGHAPPITIDPSATWASSGAMFLTGEPDGPPLHAPGDPAGLAAALLSTWRAATDHSSPRPGINILSERAAIAGLQRAGSQSCGGAARILPTLTGSVVLSLARPTDIDLVPALIGRDPGTPSWDAVASWLATTSAEEAVAWARTLGLAAAAVPQAPLDQRRPAVRATAGAPRARPRGQMRVLDLTSLWAGPLAARLLGLSGADVVKVESISRPDGARRGPVEFFDLLHQGHRCVALDFTDRADRQTLHRLARSADLVLEASRPRALAQLGLHAEALVATGVSWLSITAYGRDTDDGRRVGFGDDVAASAGLVAGDPRHPLFCADALADPLSGLAAAAAAAVAMTTPLAWLMDVSMHDVCRVAAQLPATQPRHEHIAEPQFTPANRPAAGIGHHTRDVIQQWLS